MAPLSCLFYTDGQKKRYIVKLCHVLHVALKHELHKLTMTRILSRASGLLKCVDFVYQGPELQCLLKVKEKLS